ncbi:hypothetical protein D3C87_2120170 [compost metagenome]
MGAGGGASIAHTVTRRHDLVVRQAHHEVYLTIEPPTDLILSLSKDEVVART